MSKILTSKGSIQLSRSMKKNSDNSCKGLIFPLFQSKMPFLTVFGCLDAKLSLVLLKIKKNTPLPHRQISSRLGTKGTSNLIWFMPRSAEATFWLRLPFQTSSFFLSFRFSRRVFFRCFLRVIFLQAVTYGQSL